MTRLVVETVGPATSVQDGGRFGAQRYGLPPSGAMDRTALAAANCLVGNEPFSAAIEIGPLGAAFTARGGVVCVALAGALRPADTGSGPLAMLATMLLADGESLRLGVAREGVFSYLAIAGGIPGEPTFGSLSVNQRAGLGSPYPRPLQPGDVIDVMDAAPWPSERLLHLPALPRDETIRVVMGPQDDEFDNAESALCAPEWRVSIVSDRMGYRLDGPTIQHRHGHNIVSDGTVTGSIQVPGNGQPIVLMPDRGTTGGYPKIATVISADLGRLAQMQPGRAFRFRAVNMEEAQTEARRAAMRIAELPERVREAGPSQLDLAALQEVNIAGDVVSAFDTAISQAPTSVPDKEAP